MVGMAFMKFGFLRKIFKRGLGRVLKRGAIKVFGKGGGKRIADELSVPFLCEVPIEPEIVSGGDKGRPILIQNPESHVASVFRELCGNIARRLAVLADNSPTIADTSITWVNTK